MYRWGATHRAPNQPFVHVALLLPDAPPVFVRAKNCGVLYTPHSSFVFATLWRTGSRTTWWRETRTECGLQAITCAVANK